MSYCDYADVEMLLSLTFDTNSKPTAVKVAEIIGWIASEINVTFKTSGVSIPSSGTDLYNVLVLKNAQGAAGIVALSYYGNSDAVESGLGAYLKTEYTNFLNDIKKNPSSFKDEVNSITIENQFTMGNMTDEELNDIMLPDEFLP